MFDFSNYPENEGLYVPMNKKGIGKMKDERKKILIYQLVELKPKMCSLVANEWQRNQKSKAC